MRLVVGISPRKLGFRSKVSPCPISGLQSVIGKGFSPRNLAFPCQYHSSNAPYTRSSACSFHQKDTGWSLGIFQISLLFRKSRIIWHGIYRDFCSYLSYLRQNVSWRYSFFHYLWITKAFHFGANLFRFRSKEKIADQHRSPPYKSRAVHFRSPLTIFKQNWWANPKLTASDTRQIIES